MNELSMWLTELLELVRAIGELIILFVPVPWSMSIVFLIGTLSVLLGWRLVLQLIRLLSYIILWIVELVAGLLLWPEFLMTRQMRRFGRGPIWGTYVYGAIVSGPARLFSFIAEGVSNWIQNRRWFSWFWLLLIALLPVGLWYARPYLAETSAIGYINRIFQWWLVLETWIQTGEWRILPLS